MYVCILFEESQRSLITRAMRTTKPAFLAFFSLPSNQTSLLKISKLVRGTGEKENVWTTSCSHDGFRIPPISKKGNHFVVLCSFNVRKIVSDWPFLQLRLSKNVEIKMRTFVASPPSYSFMASPQASSPIPIRSSWSTNLFQSAPIQSTSFHWESWGPCLCHPIPTLTQPITLYEIMSRCIGGALRQRSILATRVYEERKATPMGILCHLQVQRPLEVQRPLQVQRPASSHKQP